MAFEALTFLFLFYLIILPKLSGFSPYFTLIYHLIYWVTDSTEVARYKFVWVPKLYLTGDDATFLSARNTLSILGDIICRLLFHNFKIIYVFPVCSVKCSRDSNCGGFYFIQSACTLLQKEWKFHIKSKLISRKWFTLL